jgi:hypothetical protein
VANIEIKTNIIKMNDEPKIEIKETNELIAVRVPKGDRWKLVNDSGNIIHKSLTEALESYFVATKFKGDFRLAPMDGKLYAIKQTEEEIVPETPRPFNIYGEEE